jgi:hypothetical protein
MQLVMLFRKQLLKATVSFVVSVLPYFRPFVCRLEPVQLAMEGLPSNLVFGMFSGFNTLGFWV